MIPLVHCWPARVIHHAARHIKHRLRRHYGIGHRARRFAGIAISKPAAVVWVCSAVAWPVPLENGFPSIPGPEFRGFPQEMASGGELFGGSPIGGGFFSLPSELPAEIPLGSNLPIEFFNTPPNGPPADIPIGGFPIPPSEIPVSEPGSLALLGTAIAALMLMRRRA